MVNNNTQHGTNIIPKIACCKFIFLLNIYKILQSILLSKLITQCIKIEYMAHKHADN